MTVLATNTVTITSYRDTESITRYYLLQSSTAAEPSKPTTNPPPSGWTDTEPSYTSGSTNTLYFCDLMVFSDDTFDYSAVSKSSSYEAAKEAYNKAVAASDAAQAAQEDIDGLEIGGRNLIKKAELFFNRAEVTFDSTEKIDVTGIAINSTSCITFGDFPAGTYTLNYSLLNRPTFKRMISSVQFDSECVANSYYAMILGGTGYYRTMPSLPFTFTLTETTKLGFVLQANSEYNYDTVSSLKLETGNRATDWTPAPEDVDAGISNAQDTADSAKALAEEADLKLASWCAENDETLINGGKIYTGTITADKLSVSDLYAIGATIGGFTIGTSALYNGTTSLAGASNSVYMGLDGISCGTNFSVDKAGALTAKSGSISGFTIAPGSLKGNNTIGLYSNGTVSVVGSSSITQLDGTVTYPILTCQGGTISLEANSSKDLDGTILTKGKFKLDYNSMSGFSVDETTSWFTINNASKNITIYEGGSLHVLTTDSQDILCVDKDLVQVNNLCCNSDVIFPNASRVGTDDYPSGRHVLANNTSISFMNSSGVRARGIALSNADHLLLGADSNTGGMYGYITAYNNIQFYAGTGHDQCFASIYSDGARYFQSKPIYDRTTSSGTAVRVNSNGTLFRYSSSSMRYKEEITCQLCEELNPEKLYDLNVWQYKYREGHLDKGDQRYGMTHIGLLAEDVKQHYPIAANYNEDGYVEDWSERYLLPPMLKLIQMQHEEIESIKAELAKLQSV